MTGVGASAKGFWQVASWSCARWEGRKEFSAREQEIEVGVADSASALTEMQRNLLERTRKLDSAEARVTTLEAGLATLQRENASLREAAK